jgi:D-alanyl-D-alanine carboxypeptidase
MTGRVLMAAILVGFVLVPAPAQPAGQKELPPRATADRLDGPPHVTARTWAVADGKTGRVLWGSDEAEPRAMASTTKIMTAWLVLRLADDSPKVLDEVVTFSEKAAKTPGSSSKLRAGDRLPVRDLLYGLLLPSGNDAAVALAESFGPRFAGEGTPGGDPVRAFVAEMNRRAQALGLKETAYSDPNGLSRENVSSARDLAALGARAIGSRSLAQYVGTRRHICDVVGADGTKRAVTWENTNRLLDIDGYDGVKTGTTTPAGSCLVASGRRGSDHLIVVVLGSTSDAGRYADARNLFRWAWRQRGHEPEPPGPLAGAVIVVDPGHGGQAYSKSYTGGTRGVASRTTESELNLRVAFELAKVLRDRGATVHMTREADHRLSPEGSSNKDELHARIDFLEHHNCHFFLSVHHNAGGAGSTGHTALYKHNAADDTLYEALAREVNDALEGAVPGPKLKLIKGSYHILRETPIPGTISESGFMTNREFDDLSTRPDYPKKEAAAIARGAVEYWTAHKTALVALREKLAKERADKPRDPKAYTATALNPDYQARMRALLEKVAPGGKYEAAKAPEYVEAFRKAVVGDGARFTVKAEVVGGRIKLTGAVSDRKHHDRLIDLLVAMRLDDIINEVQLPKGDK